VREGRYLDVVPNRLIRYPWQMASNQPPTTVEFTLDPQGDTTGLNLVHSGWSTLGEADQVIQMHVQGWAFFLQNLKTILEGGRDERRTKLGMKTRA
jgi:uncharacterized protein YndB with AHSA1/START domain